MEPFPGWLKNLLVEQGISGAELAERMGTPRATVYRILNGERGIGKDIARKMAKALGQDEVDFFKRAGLLSDRRPSDDMTPRLWEALSLLRSMPEDEQEEEIAMLRARLERRKRGRRGKTASSGSRP